VLVLALEVLDHDGIYSRARTLLVTSPGLSRLAPERRPRRASLLLLGGQIVIALVLAALMTGFLALVGV
jgi:hypothetical protein